MPDEKDKPRDPSDFSSLKEDLQEQLRQVVEKLNNPPPAEQWTPEEQAQLNAELARIPFDPRHAHPDHNDWEVDIGGEKMPIHHFNNFPMILSIVDILRNSDEVVQPNTFEAEYASLASERKYLEISSELEKTYPALYKRTIQLFRTKGQAAPGVELNADQKAYIFSQAYSAAAYLAQELDHNYNLDFLRK